MALFLGESLSVLSLGAYVFMVCWFYFYQSIWMMAGVAVFFVVTLAMFFILGRALPDEIVDYQAGIIEFPLEEPSQIYLADLKEVRLLPEEKTRKGGTRQPIEFVLHSGQVLRRYGSYKFFRDISDYVEVYDTDGTSFYPKETYFYSMIVLWGLSALVAAAGIVSLYWRP